MLGTGVAQEENVPGSQPQKPPVRAAQPPSVVGLTLFQDERVGVSKFFDEPSIDVIAISGANNDTLRQVEANARRRNPQVASGGCGKPPVAYDPAFDERFSSKPLQVSQRLE